MRFSLFGAAKKRASLELSTNAIVVIVLAFVMLGLGLGIIQMLRSNVGPMIPDALSIGDLEKKPTPENPLTLSDTIRVQVSGKTTPLKVGFYNADAEDYKFVNMNIIQCADPTVATVTAGQELNQYDFPNVTVIPQDVDASSMVAFNVIIKAQKVASTPALTSTATSGSRMTGGKSYLCEFAVFKGESSGALTLTQQMDKTVGGKQETNKIFSKQITIQMVS